MAARYFDVSFSYDASSDAMLSSGEEKLLYLMAEIYYSHILQPKKFDNMDAPSLYVLDEAELGLHPEWQRAFVSYLLAFFDYFPLEDIQIVLTTHSPILLSDILRQDIVLLKKKMKRQSLRNSIGKRLPLIFLSCTETHFFSKMA